MLKKSLMVETMRVGFGARTVKRSAWSSPRWIKLGIICSASCPLTAQNLEDLGCKVVSVDQSELAKAEAGLTCCSVLID